MSDSQQNDRQLVIGVDAGGTKTTAWLADATFRTQQQPLGTGQAGPGNPRAVGFEDACQQILLAIENAFLNASFVRESVKALCLCAAGAGREEEQTRLKEWANEFRLASDVIVTDDAQPILAAASSQHVGIALISGTGSFAWGRNAEGETARSGGWGYLFGDEGSGYQIALAGLQAAAKAADGRGPRTELLTAFMDQFQISEPARLIEKIYGNNLIRKEIAQLVSVVFSCLNDECANEILDQAASELATMVKTLASELDLNMNDSPLALAGGVFVHQQVFVERLLNRLALTSEYVTLVNEPVAGAVVIALNKHVVPDT